MPRDAALLAEAGIAVGGSEEITVCVHGGGGIAGHLLGDGAVEPYLVITRSERQSPLEIRKCGTRPVALHFQRAEAVERLGVARRELRRALVSPRCLVEPAESAQSVAQVVERRSVARIEV